VKARSRSILWFACIAVGALHSGRALAEDALSTAEHDALIASAVEAAQQNQLQLARERLARANALVRSARTLRGLGVVAFRMERYAEAFVRLSEALREPSRPLDDELRAATTALAERASARVGFYALEVNVPVESTVDGAPALVDERGALVVDEGRHTAVFTAPAHVPKRVDFETRGGVTERWLVELKPLLAEAAVAPSPGAAESVRAERPPPLAPSPARTERDYTVTWVALAAVPVSLLGAGLAWSRAEDTGERLAATCDTRRCTPEQREQLIDASSLSTYETLTNVALTAAAVSLVVAGVTYFVESSRPATAPSVGRSPASFTVRF
jgi:hypothetical protein